MTGRFFKLIALGLGLAFTVSMMPVESKAHGCFGCGLAGGLAVGTLAGAAIQSNIDSDREDAAYGPAPNCIERDARWYCR